MNSQDTTVLAKTWNSPYFLCAVLAVVAVLFCTILTPYWQTNDDVAMMMITHGLGPIYESDPRLVFSSVIWGYITQLLHYNNYFAGYTVGTYGLIAASYATIIFCLSKFLTSRTFIALPVAIITILCTLILPQFTLTAACATVAAVFSAYTYIHVRQFRYVLLAFCLGLLGFWVRPYAFLMTCLFSLPLFPWRSMIRQPRILVIAALFLALLAGSVAVNRVAFSSPDWQKFATWEKVRGSFSSYRVSDEILANPEIYQKFNFTENDIKLMQSFFFADSKFTNPEALQSMMDMTERYESPTKWDDAHKGVSYFWTEGIIKYFSLITLILLILFPSRRVYASALLVLVVFWGISYDGHPPTFRVHASALILISFASLLISRGKLDNFKAMLAFITQKKDLPPKALTCGLCIMLVGIGIGSYKYYNKISREISHRNVTYQDYQPITHLTITEPLQKTVIHGSYFSFEHVYRPFDKFSTYPSAKFAWVAALTSAPSMYKFNSSSPDWLLDTMQNNTITIAADEVVIALIDTWVQERTGNRMCVIKQETFPIKYSDPMTLYTVNARNDNAICNGLQKVTDQEKATE